MHRSVMVEAVLRWLRPAAGRLFVDATFGGGGHAEAILAAAGPEVRLTGIDRDPERIRQIPPALEPFKSRLTLFHGRFSQALSLLPEGWAGRVDGIVLDLGVSSFQLDDSRRGFSFRREGPLDMRMDPTEGITAAAILAEAAEEEIADILYRYGEERRSRRIARAIVRARERQPLATTDALARVVERALGGRRGRLHPATRTFQALRIAVNEELEELERGLPALRDCLAPGGRLAVISFHSLEDRIVKTAFRRWAEEKKGKILTAKPERPSREETAVNPRARSAKLRAVERR